MAKEKEKLAVETLSLTKSYNGKAAVNHLSMQVRQGAIYGFIGRNGAGKSTTLRAFLLPVSASPVEASALSTLFSSVSPMHLAFIIMFCLA